MSRILRHLFAPALLLLFSVLVLAARADGPLQRFESVEPHMGTLVRITVYAENADTAREAFRAGFHRIGDLDRTLSDYKPDSELNTVTRTAVGRAVPVSADLFAVLQGSQALAEATGGAFDVTQGPVVALWRDARRSKRLPDHAALEAAAARTGFRKMRLDEANRTVSFDLSGMQLDVGGIGKGFAASEALTRISALGIESALVAISGDLAFSGAPPGQRGWRIRVHDNAPALDGIPQVVELTHAATSTSGNLEQHVDAGGQRYSHIIDPASRMGLVSDLTVTVVARHGLEADGLDTAISVMGPERGLALIESHPRAAALIIDRTAGTMRVSLSPRFRQLIAAQ